MATTLSQSGFAPGAKLMLRAALTEYGVPVDRRAEVNALITDPVGGQRQLSLVETAPGVFELDMQATYAGIYTFRVFARGRTLRHREFTREAVRTGTVWVGGERPAPSSSRDRPDEALCRLLQCLLSERVVQPELRKRLVAAGLDVDALLRCVANACNERGEKRLNLASLEPHLIEALKAVLVDDRSL